MLNILKDFNRVWHPGLLHRLNSHEILGQVYGLLLFFLSNRCLPVVLDENFSQEYVVTAAVPQGSILGFTLLLLYIDLHDDVICNTVIYADDTTLYSNCYQASDLWQQLKMATELESDL